MKKNDGMKIKNEPSLISSIFYDRFLQLVKELKFAPISLDSDLDEAAELILTDSKHLDNNPKPVTKKDIILLLEQINQGALSN